MVYTEMRASEARRQCRRVLALFLDEREELCSPRVRWKAMVRPRKVIMRSCWKITPAM